MTTRSAAPRRSLATGVLVAALLAAGTGTAAAHVEVSASGATAGAGPVTVTFSAESESTSAGIAAMRTRLPEGIAPADVSLASGPAGWALTPTADGFEVGGPALPVGEDAEYAITVARLPAGATELAFPTLQRYADGREDAWIERPPAGAPEPESPAPVLTVAPGAPAPATAPATGTTTSSATSAQQTAATATTPAAEEEDDGGVAAGWLVGLGVLVVAAVAGGLWVRRSRAGR